VTAGCGYWKETEDGTGRKAERRQKAQIAITPTRRVLPACMGTWSVASPAVHLWGNGRSSALLTSVSVRCPGPSLLNPCRRRRWRKREENNVCPASTEPTEHWAPGNTRVAVTRSFPQAFDSTDAVQLYPNTASDGPASTNYPHPTSSSSSCRCTRLYPKYT
jgi:hypothetical protein